MSSTVKQKKTFKDKLFHELVEYWINVCYLTLAFATFTWYRRIILDAHDITYTNYGFAVINALILGKVIMLGDVFRLGRSLESKPLIYSTLYKTISFTLFVGGFTVFEHCLKGLWNGTGLMGGLNAFLGKGIHELFANSLVVFVAFFPFFGFKELGRVLGQDKIRAIFYGKRNG